MKLLSKECCLQQSSAIRVRKRLEGQFCAPELLGNLLNQAQQLRAGLVSICHLAMRWKVHQELAGFAGLRR